LSSNALNIWTGAALAAGASIAVLAGAFKAFQAVKNIAADLDKAQKAADRLGVTFQSFQALEFVAARSGLEGIERVLQRLGRAVGDSIRETGEARDAFNDLGLSWRELAKLTPVEQIIRLSDAFVALGDAQKGVSIASQIFGARQARAINILLTRGGGIDKMIQRARDLGLVLDESAGRQAERLTDRMTELDLQFQVLGQRIALEFMPAIERALQRLVEEFPSALARLSLLIQDLPLLPDFRTTGSAFLEMVRIAEKLTEIQERNKELQETPDRGSRTAIFEGGVSRGYLGDLILAEEKTNKLEESTLKLNLALLALFRASQSAVDEQDIEEVRAFAEVVRNLIPDELSKTKLFPGFITDAEEANKAIDEYLARVITLGELLDRVAVKNAGAFTVAPEARAAILKIRQLNDEIASTGRIISQLTGPDVDFATIIRAEEAGVEARKFTDVIRNLRNQVSQYNAVVDILNAQREAGTPLGFELKALEDAEITAEDATNAIEKLDDALTGLFTEKSQGNALEALRVSLVRSTFEQKQQLSIIQAQGADRAILAERIKAETAARRANEGVIDEETAALIEQREILARELVRSERLQQFSQDFENAIADPIERALAGGIESFEDFFDAVLSGWRALAAQMIREQLFNPENFGFSSQSGFGGFFNKLGFNIGDAATPIQRQRDIALFDIAGATAGTESNTGAIAKVAATPIHTDRTFLDAQRAQIGAPPGGFQGFLDTGSGAGVGGFGSFTQLAGGAATGIIAGIGLGQLAQQLSGQNAVAQAASEIGTFVGAALGAVIGGIYGGPGGAALGGAAGGAAGGFVFGAHGQLIGQGFNPFADSFEDTWRATAAITGDLVISGIIAAIHNAFKGDVTTAAQIETAVRPEELQSFSKREGFRETPFGAVGIQTRRFSELGDGRQAALNIIDTINSIDTAIARALTDVEIEEVSEALIGFGRFQEITRDPRNDIGALFLDRINRIMETLGADPRAFGLALDQTGGFFLEAQQEALSDFIQKRGEGLFAIQQLGGTVFSEASTALRNLEKQFNELSASLPSVGFAIEEIIAAFEEGQHVLRVGFDFNIERQLVSIQDPFIASLEAIRGETEALLRSAVDFGVSTEHVLELNRIKVGEAVERMIAPIVSVIEAIQIDRAAPLETLEILEARFESARAGTDPSALATAAQNLLAATEATFGRTDIFFERSAFIEASLTVFNERIQAQGDAQIALVQQQLIAIETGNATSAQLMEQMIEILRGIREDNGELIDFIELANAKKVA
jgi:hypothetical protein